MIIRQEQIATFRRNAEAAFEDDCCEYLCRYQPVLADASGADKFKDAARSGLQRARRYDLYQRAAARLYLELTVTLGGSFDTDPQFRWLLPVLGMRELPPLERANLLYWHVSRFLDHSCGRGDLGADVLRRLAGLDLNKLQHVAEDYNGRATAFMEWLHPGKVDFIGANDMAALLTAAASSAREKGLSSPEGAVVVLALAVTFGYGVMDDPIHAWVQRTLNSAAQDPAAKLDALLAQTITLAQRLGQS